MPYSLREEDGKWCVYNKDTNENKGCSDSREMAVQHMRALYAHEPGAKSGPLSLEMTITKAEKTSQGFIRWRARCNTGEVDAQNEKFDGSFWLDIVHNFMQVQKALSASEKAPLPIPILDVAHYSMFLGPENRMKARAGWPNRLWIDGKALMAEGFYDDTPLGKASAAAGMRPDAKRPKISICVYPDWGNVSVEDGTLTYKGGRDVAYLDHLAQTMYPVNANTDIVAEVSMEAKSTIAQDAAEVLGDDELAKKLEEARAAAKSTATIPEGAVVKADDTTQPAPQAAPTDAPVVEGQPIEKAAPVAMTPCACGGTCGAGNAPVEKTEPKAPEPQPTPEPQPEVKSNPLADKYEALAKLVVTLSESLPKAITDLSAKVEGLVADVDALKVSDTAKVKSAIDSGGDWLQKFYDPRKAADNKVTPDEVAKAEPKSQVSQMDGIWGHIQDVVNKTPGG